jgi:AAA ATPase domain
VPRKPAATRKAGPVGRSDVLTELRRAVDQVAAGRGQILLLAGEAGIGKTTMLAAAPDYAESRGVRGAWGWGWPGEGVPGYWPWVQVMRMLGIPWPSQQVRAAAGDAPASERFRLFDEVTSLLLAESRIQPLLVLLDDLQWAGRPSQLLLDFLARRLPAGAVAVVGSYRDTEPVPGPVPGSALALQRAAEVAAGVHRRTGGNPFFVQQVSLLLRSGQDGIPPGVHEALELRFEALPGSTATALRTPSSASGSPRTSLPGCPASGPRP